MINEEIIIRQMKEGNQLAFTLLFNEYSKQVYSLAFKYLYNRELAEDVVQNVFFKIWEKKKDIDESRPFNRYHYSKERSAECSARQRQGDISYLR